jgi:hypothetical protein
VILGYAPLEGTGGIIAIDEDQVRSSMTTYLAT